MGNTPHLGLRKENFLLVIEKIQTKSPFISHPFETISTRPGGIHPVICQELGIGIIRPIQKFIQVRTHLIHPIIGTSTGTVKIIIHRMSFHLRVITIRPN